MFALATPVLIGGAGLAVETSFDYLSHNHLQSAADAAAYAAAIESMGGANAATILAAATQQATANGWVAGSITVNNPPTSGPNQGAANAVEVRLTQNTPRFFTALFNPGTFSIAVRSVGITQSAASACILALNPSASKAIQIQGNTTVTLAGCDVMADSIASDAVNVWGSGQISAECAVSVGGVANHGGLTMTGCPSPITNAPRVGDPFAGLPTPAPGPVQSVPNGNTVTLSPGDYSGGMTLHGNVTLNPGVYYVSNTFRINSNATVSGSGVTIYMTSGTTVSMAGNADVNLAAPTSGTYSGILFFGARDSSGSVTLNGDATSHLTGDLYFPAQQVSYIGNFTGVNGCTQVVADTVSWSGNSNISVNCAAAGMQNIPARQAVKLVE
jgi:Flp pilus assembly protein TadG